MRSEEWWCAASNWKAARVFEIGNAFACFLIALSYELGACKRLARDAGRNGGLK